MAVRMNAGIRVKDDPFLADTMRFQRRQKKIKFPKNRKKSRIGFRFIIISFISLCGLFFLLQKAYLFLLTWDHLQVQTVDITCPDDTVRQETYQYLAGNTWGNILLFNINALQDSLNLRPFIKRANVRKVFPSTIKIDVVPRIPVACVKMASIFLVDKEGVLIKEAGPEDTRDLPLFVDARNFKEDLQEKLVIALGCLESLSMPLRERLAVLDLSRPNKLVVTLKDDRVRLFLDSHKFADKLAGFMNIRTSLNQYGTLDYVDLRFDDRIYIKALTDDNQEHVPNSMKGVK